jgi:hypothetical protein
MYVDIEVQADRYEEEQAILQELAQEEFENEEIVRIFIPQESDDINDLPF